MIKLIAVFDFMIKTNLPVALPVGPGVASGLFLSMFVSKKLSIEHGANR